MKHLEIKTIKHRETEVTVKIDYDKGTISFVDIKGVNITNTNYPPKQWTFVNRTIEYMDGWIMILDAIKFAIEESRKDLQEYFDTKAKEKESFF